MCVSAAPARARWEHSIFLTAPRPARRQTAAAILCFRPLFTLRRRPSGGKIPLENQIITAALEHAGKPGAKARCPVCHFCRLRQPERRSLATGRIEACIIDRRSPRQASHASKCCRNAGPPLHACTDAPSAIDLILGNSTMRTSLAGFIRQSRKVRIRRAT